MLPPNKLPIIFTENPGRIVSAGKAILFIATVLIVIAAYGKWLLLITSLKLFARDKLITTSLAELGLPWPTWFVAETLPGYIALVLVACFGLYLVYYGRCIKRFIDSLMR